MCAGRRQLTYEERKLIEDYLDRAKSFSFIAMKLGVNETTISREIRRNKIVSWWYSESFGGTSDCKLSASCKITGLCNNSCRARCKICPTTDCRNYCTLYEPRICPTLQKKPYVCNACPHLATRLSCGFRVFVYLAREAQEQTRERKSESQKGLSLSEEELASLLALVKPLIEKGQSPATIWRTHADQIPITWRTFYTYVESGELDIRNLDLPRKVRYKPRKVQKQNSLTNRKSVIGRTYDVFSELSVEQRACTVEMDCVEGTRGSGKVILTLMFRVCRFQIMVLLERHTKQAVAQALDEIEQQIGLDVFREHFGIILTDRGHEFLDRHLLEASCTKPEEKRCQIFYCDPNRPDQKGLCERNHSELRKILPKGTSFVGLTQEKVTLASSHINSMPRESLSGSSPIAQAKELLGPDVAGLFGTFEVPPEEITLKPYLLSCN